MPNFVRSVLLQAPLPAVFAFHEREDALQLLSPTFPPTKVIRRSGGIEVGARVQLKVGPFTWVALHTGFERDRFFEDRQIGGPFAEWIHRHEFEAEGTATRLTDRVEYRLPGGDWINLLFGWVVQLGLSQMFAHRHRMTKLYCEVPRAGKIN